MVNSGAGTASGVPAAMGREAQRGGGQRLRRRDPPGAGNTVPARAGSGHEDSSRFSSSSTTDASSLANSGFGTVSGVPGRTGTGAHLATSA